MKAVAPIRRRWRGLGRTLARLHRNERGEMIEYGLVLAAIALPLIFLFDKLFEVLSDYFGMIAFYVSWPFM